MNRLLERQLKSIFGKEYDLKSFDSKIQTLLTAVGEAYDENDKTKRLLMHTISINSEELMQAYHKIEEHNNTLQSQVDEKSKLLQQYKNAIDEIMIVSKADIKGYITYVNEKFCELSGYSKEELLGKEHNMIRHPSVSPHVFKEMWRNISKKKSWHGEIQNKHKNGTSYFVDAHIYPLLDTQNNIIEYIAIRSDITNRVLIEKRLEKESKFNQMLFDNQDNIVFTVSKTDGITQVNKKFLNFFGVKKLEEFSVDYSCICELFILKEGFLTPSTGSVHWTDELVKYPHKQHKAIMKNLEGTERIFSVVLSELNFDDKRYTIISFSDITDIDKAREAAENSEKLKSDFMANMSHEIRTPMNSIVGFAQLLNNTALTSTQVKYTELIEQSTFILLKVVNDILDFSKIESGNFEIDAIAINPFVTLHNAIVHFRPNAKEKDISYLIEIDPNINECLMIDELRLAQVLNNLINNALKFTPSEGTVHVEVRLVSTSKTKQKLHFSIRDTGIGIEESRQNKIFDSFVQADTSTTRKFGGTGLGLSISSSLCRLMGSELKVKSTINKGSTFYFEVDFERCNSDIRLGSTIINPPIYIVENSSLIYSKTVEILKSFKLSFHIVPMDKVPVFDFKDHIIIMFDYLEFLSLDLDNNKIILIDERKAAENLSKKIDNIYYLGMLEETASDLYNALYYYNVLEKPMELKNKYNFHMQVLVAEDYEANRILIEEILNVYGVTVDFAFDGIEAVEMAGKKSYDIILMDINMPNLNGIDAMHKIKNLGISTPIVAVTANALHGDKEKFLREGMDEYLSKPIEREALLKILKKYENREKQVEDADIFCNKLIANLLVAKENMQFSIEIMEKLFNSFVASSIDTMGKLECAIKDENIEAIKMHAHAIRGSASSLHLEEVAEWCRILEYEESTEYGSAFIELKLYMEQLHQEQNKLLAKLKDI